MKIQIEKYSENPPLWELTDFGVKDLIELEELLTLSAGVPSNRFKELLFDLRKVNSSIDFPRAS